MVCSLCSIVPFYSVQFVRFQPSKKAQLKSLGWLNRAFYRH